MCDDVGNYMTVMKCIWGNLVLEIKSPRRRKEEKKNTHTHCVFSELELSDEFRRERERERARMTEILDTINGKR